MPVTWQVERLESAVAEALGDRYHIEQTDLEGLPEAFRHAAIDAIVAGEESPFVLVAGRVACSGSIEPGRVLEALSANR